MVETTPPQDRRARIRPKLDGADYIYGESGLLQILRQTDGMAWPYTPTINVAQQVDYSSYDPVHANQEFLTFSRTKAPQITCVGAFTAQNKSEALYMLACVHFLRSVTKMDFGINADRPGTPPPILLFSAWGQFMFNDLPVVITNFTYDLPGDRDYVKVPISAETERVFENLQSPTTNNSSDTYVPTELNIAVTMTVQNSPKRQTNKFDLKSFKSGKLLRDSQTKGWI